MKRTPLKRKTQLKSKNLSGNRQPICRVSKKQEAELARRRKLKAELLAEYGAVCMRCQKPPDFRGLHLVHIISLAQGGKTNRRNCRIWCAPCHFGKDGHRTELINT